MPRVEFVCLANSWKKGGRCVAGLRVGTSQWIRPVSTSEHGELRLNHYQMSNRRPIDLLDVAQIELSRAVPTHTQPENWTVGKGTWQFVRSLNAREALDLLEPALVQGPVLLGSRNDRVPADHKQSASLALVEPEQLSWVVTTNARDKRQLRARFSLSGQHFNLSVTDPVWYQKTSKLEHGTHPRGVSGIRHSDRLLLTISLSEPLDGTCYKLVAGVIHLRSEPQLLRGLPGLEARARSWLGRLLGSRGPR